MIKLLGRLLNIDNLESIERMDPSLAAPWVHDYVAWMLPACLALCALAALFYLRVQTRGRRSLRIMLAVSRSILLCLILLFLADPVMIIRLTHSPRPWFWVLFDGSDSMALEDQFSDSERRALAAAVGLSHTGQPVKNANLPSHPSRSEFVQALLKRPDNNLDRGLSEKYRLKGFRFERPDGATELANQTSADEPLDPARWAGQLSTAGKVTALGQALEDLASRQSSGQLAGLLVVSDFDQNSGPPAVVAAQKLGIPVYTLAVGAQAPADPALDLQGALASEKVGTHGAGSHAPQHRA